MSAPGGDRVPHPLYSTAVLASLVDSQGGLVLFFFPGHLLLRFFTSIHLLIPSLFCVAFLPTATGLSLLTVHCHSCISIWYHFCCPSFGFGCLGKRINLALKLRLWKERY